MNINVIQNVKTLNMDNYMRNNFTIFFTISTLSKHDKMAKNQELHLY